MSGEHGYGMLGPTGVQLWYSEFSAGQVWVPESLKKLQKPEGRCLVMRLPSKGPEPLCRDETERTWSNTVGHTAAQLLPGQFPR